MTGYEDRVRWYGPHPDWLLVEEGSGLGASFSPMRILYSALAH